MSKSFDSPKTKQQFLNEFTAYINSARQLSFGDEGDPLKPKFVEYARTISSISFAQYLRNLIVTKEMSDVDVYTRAGITKNLFYRILSVDNTYHTSKDKVAAFTIALRLNLVEAEDLYLVAGYNLTKSELPDLIIRFCIENKIYLIDDVNYCLIYYGYKPLGSTVQEKPNKTEK